MLEYKETSDYTLWKLTQVLRIYFVCDFYMIQNILYHMFLISVLADLFKCTGTICAIWLYVVLQSRCLILKQNNLLNQYQANTQNIIAKSERKGWNNLLSIILISQLNWSKFCFDLPQFGPFPVELLCVSANKTEIILCLELLRKVLPAVKLQIM